MLQSSIMRKLSLVLFAVLLFAGCGQVNSTPTTSTALKAFLSKSSKPAVIKFYASWCGSCKEYAPAFNEVKLAKSASVDFFEVDVDASQTKALIKELKISRIPETAFVSADRSNVSKRLGPISVKDLTKLVEELKAK